MRTAYRLCAAMMIFLAINSIGCNKSSNTPSPSGSPSASGGSQANPSTAGGTSSSANNAQPNSPGGNEPAPTPQPIVIPAGKVISVRLSQPLDSKENHPGDTFSGSVAEAVEVDGRAVIERGAAVHGTVVEAKAMGHFKGGALLQLQLTSVTINGERRPVQTALWSQTLKGKGKRSAIAIGGGAGLGAALGGIFGGGKGAAIGATAGAGAGTAGAAYTGNKEIHLPAESAVQFRLKQSIRVQ